MVDCPNCRNTIPESSWDLHKVACERHNYYCQECEMVMRKHERDKHDAEQHSMFQCECGEEFTAADLNTHQTNECPNRLEECIWCNCTVESCELFEHEHMCKQVMEKCPQCAKDISRLQYVNHSDECEQRIVTCVYCEYPLPMIDLLRHEEICGDRTSECEKCGERVKYSILSEHHCSQGNQPPPTADLQHPEPLDGHQTDPITPAELFICPFCLEPQSDDMDLQTHIFTGHPETII